MTCLREPMRWKAKLFSELQIADEVDEVADKGGDIMLAWLAEARPITWLLCNRAHGVS